MADIEKVKQGIKKCISDHDCYQDCPYFDDCHDVKKPMFADLAKDALSVIEELQAEIERLRQPEWTYASEGMPKYECYGRKYWVYTQYKKPNGEVGGRRVQLLRWEQTTLRGKTVERFKTPWDGVVYDEILAWMPLKEPEPPMMG